jgi:hypothetical protein
MKHWSSQASGLDRVAPRGRRAALLACLLVVAFVGVSIAKPWGTPAATPRSGPTPSRAAPTSQEVTVPIAAATQAPVKSVPVAFITPVPPPAKTAWTAIQWHRLAPDDPLTLVASARRWRGGFIALGWEISEGKIATPVWTSADGAHWDLLPSDTSTTFWPGVSIVGVAEAPTGLVVVTEPGVGSRCSGSPCAPAYGPPTMSWTSPDGRTWSPSESLYLGLPGPGADEPMLAAGPAGLVAMSNGPGAQVAISSDGISWRTLPAGTLPKAIVIADLRATATGYVAGGRWMTNDGHWDAATLWSADGRVWTTTRAMPLATSRGPMPTGAGTSSVVDSFAAGRDGLIAIGRGVASPGAELWWQSTDGRHWLPVPTYLPLGRTTCPSPDCALHANGVLVGDGERMVALRGGPDAGVWTSFNGLAWQRLSVTGDLPSDQARQAVLLPGGVLLSDATQSWFGEAVTE